MSLFHFNADSKFFNFLVFMDQQRYYCYCKQHIRYIINHWLNRFPYKLKILVYIIFNSCVIYATVHKLVNVR